MFLSLLFASMLMFCSYPFPFSCLPVFFIILHWKSKKNMHLEFGFRVSPLPIALPAINSTQCISVHCLAHDLSDSSVIFLLTCLHCLSFSFLFVLLACCLPLPFHFSCPPVFFIILYWKSKKNMHLEFGFRVSPLSTALPAVNSTQCTVWLTTCEVSVIFLSTCLHFLSCSFLFFLLAC